MAEKIKGLTLEIGGDTTALTKALSGVNKTTKDLQSELKNVERLLKLDPKNTELLSQKQKILAESVSTTREKLDTLKEAERQTQEQFKQGKISEEQYRALQREVIKTEQDLQKFERQLSATVKTTETWQQKLDKASNSLKNAGTKMTDMGKGLSTKVTAPIAAIGAVAAKTGMDFEAAMSEVGAISGATGKDLEALEAKAKEMGATTKFSASQSAEALKYMAMAGWDTTKMLDGLSGVMNLAAASGEELGTVSDIVTDAMTAFGMEANRANGFADVLAATSSKANTNVSMLGESFKYVAPVAGALGYSAQDTAVALGLMANAGIKGSQSGTALRATISRLVKPTKESGTSMNQLGISILDSEGKMKSLAEIMGDLRSAMRDLDPDQQAFHAAQIAGQEAMSGLLAIVNTSEEDYNKLSNAINNADGTAQKMADTMQDNLAGKLTLLKSALEGVAIQIYDALQPALEILVAIIQKVVAWFANLSPGMQATIVIIAGIAAAIGPLLIVLGMMASGLGAIIAVGGKLLLLLPKIGAAFTLLTGPIGIVIAIIAAFTVAWIKWGDDVKRIVRQTIDNVKNFFGDMAKAGKDLIKGLWEGIKSMGTWFKNLVVGFVDNKLIGPIKKLLKISSPSKLMEEIGKFITLGLANGIESGGDVLNEKAKKVVTQATETMMKAVDEYNNQVEKALENMALEEEKLTQEYEGQLDRRKSALYNWIGIFDKVPEKMKVTGKELLENLKGQVIYFSDWQNEIAELSKKAVDEGLINELRQMGPKALPQIEALNNMSGHELEKYVSLWQEKHELAKEEATDELEGLKAETNKKIDELHKKTNEQLELYAIDFVKKMNGIRVKTGDELKAMSVEAQTHGASMITNLVNGILDKLPELNSAMARVRTAMDVGEGGMGISMGFTGIPAMATGTNYIPQDMLAYLHKGEAVVPAKYNPQNTPTTVIKEIHIHGNNADEIWTKFERELHKVGVVF